MGAYTPDATLEQVPVSQRSALDRTLDRLSVSSAGHMHDLINNAAKTTAGPATMPMPSIPEATGTAQHAAPPVAAGDVCNQQAHAKIGEMENQLTAMQTEVQEFMTHMHSFKARAEERLSNVSGGSHSSTASAPFLGNPLNCQSKPSVMPANTAPRPRVCTQDDVVQRAAWAKDSILEIYSASSGMWNVAHVIWIAKSSSGPEVLTLQFYQEDGAKNKSLYRNDHQMAPLGTHTMGKLPPGCQLVSSQSRPGQTSYMDTLTGVRYETVEQVWKVRFERMQKLAAPDSVANKACLASPGAHDPRGISNLMPTESFPLEGAVFNNMLPHMQEHMGPSVAEMAANAAAAAPRDPMAGGKVALPAFAEHHLNTKQMLDSMGNPDDTMITNGMNLAAQLMGKHAALGMAPCVNAGTVRKFELIK
jgi:TolA-binding protein